MKKNIFVLNIIYTSIEDTVGLDTYVFNSFKEAVNKYRTEELEWLEGQKHRLGMNDEEIDQWISEHLHQDIHYIEGLYRTYIYDDGDEKVFAIEKHEIDTGVLYALTKESVFTDNQFEIDHSLEMVTTDFEKALKKAYELRDEAKNCMPNCIDAESLKKDTYEFVRVDPENGDRIHLVLKQTRAE